MGTGNENSGATPAKDQQYIVSIDLLHKSVPAQGGPIPVEHFVYASSLYGTTFAMYCIVKGNVNSSTPPLFVVDELTLKLVNYVGQLNLGFKDPPIFEWKSKEPHITFSIQGEGDELETVLDLRGISPRLEIEKGVPVTVTFTRELHPLAGFFTDINFPSDGSRRPDKISLPKEQKIRVFDTEFNTRNGTDIYFNPLRAGMKGSLEPDTNDLPSRRCNKSVVRLVFGK